MKGYGLSSSNGAAWACPHGTWAVSGERTVAVLVGARLISSTTSFWTKQVMRPDSREKWASSLHGGARRPHCQGPGHERKNGLLWQHDIPLTPATCPPMTFVRGGQTSHHRCPLPPPTAIPTFDRTCFILEAKWSYWMFLKAEGPGEYGIGKWFSQHSGEWGCLPEMIRKTGLRGRHLRLREWSPQRPRAWWRGLVSPTGSHSHL